MGRKIVLATYTFHDKYLPSSVITTPGCKEIAMPFNPATSILLCSYLVNKILASIVVFTTLINVDIAGPYHVSYEQ
jgi:hypothetical protein